MFTSTYHTLGASSGTYWATIGESDNHVFASREDSVRIGNKGNELIAGNDRVGDDGHWVVV